MKRVEDKQAIKKFIVTILISFLAGGVVGFCSAMAEGEGVADAIAGGLYRFLKSGLPYFIPVLLVVQWVVYVVWYRKSKKLYARCGDEDEAAVERVEIWLSYLILMTSIMLVCYFFVFGCSLVINFQRSDELSLVYDFGMILFYIAGVVSCMMMQFQIFSFEKEINPEKKVSYFDTKFIKKWEESCDEAERLMIYKSSYQAYKAVHLCCIVLWVFCSMGSLFWDIGVLPVTMVSVIWLVCMVSYCLASIRLSKSRNQVKSSGVGNRD